jgi:hypothetical protein
VETRLRSRGGRKERRTRSVLSLSLTGEGFLAESPHKLLPDFQPPCRCAGNMTLRDCETGIGVSPSAWARQAVGGTRVTVADLLLHVVSGDSLNKAIRTYQVLSVFFPIASPHQVRKQCRHFSLLGVYDESHTPLHIQIVDRNRYTSLPDTQQLLLLAFSDILLCAAFLYQHTSDIVRDLLSQAHHI